MTDLGVYIHVPWCRRLCPYCDFPVVVTATEPPHRAYLQLILDELAAHGYDPSLHEDGVGAWA